ncbi:MAG: hypothetical protein IPK26_18540 [Planctomycetes bacterium]|nr:hypothetical protein [Planctomycetota bacterium]
MRAVITPGRRIAVGLLLGGVATAQWGFQVQAGASAPPPQIESSMTFDAGRAVTVMHDSQSGATWTFDGQSWLQQQPANAPPARRFASMAFDLIRNVTVLYGGRGGISPTFPALDETWLWDGTDWQQAFPANTPRGREGHAMAFDLARARLVLYGGRAAAGIPQASDETWEFDGLDWQQMTPPSSPGRLEQHAMCYDIARGTVVLYGGVDPAGLGSLLLGTWTYDGSSWAQTVLPLEPAPRIHARMVQDTRRAVAVLVGGYEPTTGVIFNDTWEWNGIWRQVPGAVGGVSPPRYEPMVAFDDLRGRLVMFGGRTANNAMLAETWEYGAQYRTFGSGCAGTAGIPRLIGSARPRFGTVGANTVSNLAAGANLAIFVTGLSNMTSPLGSLPRLLTPFGLPNCRLYVSPDLFQVVPATAGVGNWTWSVPNNLALFGASFFQQVACLDPGVNAAGLTVSNALAATIGW